MSLTLRGVRLAASLVLAVAALGGTAARWGSPTYDLSRAQAKAGAYNYVVVQRDAFEGAPGYALGWTDHTTRRNYVFVDRIAELPVDSRPKVARKIGMHEVGHSRWRARGHSIPDMHDWWRYIRRSAFTGYSEQKIEEDYAETYSRCKDFQTGVSYTWRNPRPTTADLPRLCAEL